MLHKLLYLLFPVLPVLAAALGLSCVVLFGLWASRAKRRRRARIGIAASLVVFLAGWLSTSPLTLFLMGAIYALLYPANDYYGWVVDYYAPCVVMLAASNVVGIVGIWAGLGRSHRFLRAAAIAVISPLLLLVRAYEPCFVFLVQSAVIVVPLWIARNIRGRESLGGPTTLPVQRVGSSRFQFGVSDLLAIILLVATVLSVAVSSPEEIAVHYSRHGGFTMTRPSPPSPVLMGALGVVLGVVVLLAAWVTLSRRVWWLRVMGFLVAWPGFLCMLWLALWREATGRRFRTHPVSAAGGFDRDFTSPVRRAFGRAGLILLSLLILVPLGVVYYHLAFPPPIPEVALPEPNAYDDLLAASERLERTLRDQGASLPGVWHEASTSDVLAFRASNQRTWNATLQEVRATLDRPSRVPLHYSAIEFGRFESTGDLASAFKIEGKVAASEGRVLDAIQCFSDIIRLGRATGKGGLWIDWLAGLGVEEVGIEQLHNLAPSLDASQCRTAIGALAAEDQDREPLEQVWQRERVWGARAIGWSGRLCMLFVRRDRKQLRWTYARPKETRAALRIAMTELAVRAYSLDHDGPPDGLAQLVPDYLPAVPVDPLTGQPPVYELNEQEYALHSPEIKYGWAAPPQPNP